MPSRAGSPNKSTLEIRKKLERHKGSLVKGLIELTKSDNEQVRVKATELALAYAFGKPSQAVEASVSGGITVTWQS